ncbi:MAG TPA: anthranilate phosphoribosyltransferase [Spirochaetota bacterium]|nr:anthranilate phosphoribosyltransferase [Spirochaetota bacterium]HPV39906.1 anthranilate phosphoribosyltransferase [Spirochaetota bacterium]
MEKLVKKVNSGERLSFEDARTLFEGMVQGMLTESQIASALIAMKFRRETVDEVAALAATLDCHKRKFETVSSGTIDTCGTGGDGKSTVNISTAVSIILSSLGCGVVKHGNTAQSGVVGSADILSDLGMDLDYGGTSPEEFFSRHNYVFMLAPRYHPALKGIGKVRRELKVPTIFNFVGPLVNPADPAYQVIGISRRDRLDFIAQVIRKIGRSNITVYSSRDGYDEVSSRDTTECIHIGEGNDRRFSIDPSDFFEPFPMPVVRDRSEAKQLFLEGLSGANERMSDIFSLNAALALRTMNSHGMRDGFQLVKRHIAAGGAMQKLNDLVGSGSILKQAMQG